MSEHITRRNQEMEKYVEIQPVVIEGFPDAHNVFLKATNQRFCISQYGCETKDKAEWLRDMLCVALAKIVVDSRHAQRAPDGFNAVQEMVVGERLSWCVVHVVPMKRTILQDFGQGVDAMRAADKALKAMSSAVTSTSPHPIDNKRDSAS